MDLKGNSWVGSIYHKFEAICQEVDDFVSKDTVKFVENQVQSVGVSVKRLYSDVVRDILPPLGDDSKTKAQSVTGQQDDMRDDLKSIISNMTMPNCGNEEQLPVEQDCSDVLNECKTSRLSDLDLVMCCAKPCEHSSEANTDASLKQYGDTMMQNNAGNDFEEKITKVTPFTANSSSKNKAMFVTSDKDNLENEDQNNMMLSKSSSPELSVHDPQLLALKQQGILCCSFSNGTEHFSDITSDSWLPEGELPLVQDINLVENTSSSEPPEASAEKAGQYITLCMDSSTSLANDVLNECKTSRSSDLDLCAKLCEHSSQANTDLSLKEGGDTMMQNNAGDDFEEKITKVTPVTASSSSKNKAMFVTSDKDNLDNEDRNNITLSKSSSAELLVHDPQLLAFKQQGILCCSFSNTKHFSNIASASCLSEGELPLVHDINLVENRSSSEPPPEASAEKARQYIILRMDSSTSLASDAAQSASGKDWTLHHSFSTKDQCAMVSNAAQSPELVFSYFSCDGEEAEKSVISSSCSTASEPLNLLDSTSASFTQRDENNCNTRVESNKCMCNISNDHACSPSSATAANEIKGVDKLPALSILESNVGSSESNHAQCCKETQPTFLIPSSETGNSSIGVGINDLAMETIDLSSSVKCDVLNCNFDHATSHRQKNFRYYKKLILDAFASRKRLTKEYEHLAIWYGDIGTESKQHFAPNSLPSSPTAFAHAAKTFDSEWELL